MKRISVSLLYIHIPDDTITYKHLYIHFTQLRKRDAEIGKQLKPANARFEPGCCLYFFPE